MFVGGGKGKDYAGGQIDHAETLNWEERKPVGAE